MPSRENCRKEVGVLEPVIFEVEDAKAGYLSGEGGNDGSMV